MDHREIKRLFAYNYTVVLENVNKRGNAFDSQYVANKAYELTTQYVEKLKKLAPEEPKNNTLSRSPWDPRKQKYHYDESLEFCRAIGKAILGEDGDPFNVNPW
jgi:hypothetical protein